MRFLDTESNGTICQPEVRLLASSESNSIPSSDAASLSEKLYFFSDYSRLDILSVVRQQLELEHLELLEKQKQQTDASPTSSVSDCSSPSSPSSSIPPPKIG